MCEYFWKVALEIRIIDLESCEDFRYPDIRWLGQCIDRTETICVWMRIMEISYHGLCLTRWSRDVSRIPIYLQVCDNPQEHGHPLDSRSHNSISSDWTIIYGEELIDLTCGDMYSFCSRIENISDFLCEMWWDGIHRDKSKKIYLKSISPTRSITLIGWENDSKNLHA